MTKAVAEIRTINPMPVADSHNDIIANISFSQDLEANVDVSYTFSGYCAMGIREAVLLLPEDKKKNLIQTIVSIAGKSEDIQKSAVTGEAFENYSSGAPVLIKATVSAPQFTEKAGAKYIFKVGDVIGKQSELYQTSQRKQPVDIEYPHSLNRTLTVNIPNGYTILNPETLTMKSECKDEKGEVGASFVSSYKIEGNKLVVNIVEFYSQLHYRISDFENFRKVINAAADFNKITLLLAKS